MRLRYSEFLARLEFRVAEGDRIRRRRQCRGCGVPIADVTSPGGPINIDGTRHRPTCTKRYWQHP